MSINASFTLTTDSLQMYVEYNFDYYNDPETGEQFFRLLFDLTWLDGAYRIGGSADYPGYGEVYDLPGAVDGAYTIEINAQEEWSRDTARLVKHAVVATHGTADQDVAGTALDDVVFSGAFRDVVRLLDGNDLVRSGEGADTIHGGAGADVIDGEGGADLMFGGTGDDTFFIDAVGDRVVEPGGEGRDSILSSVSFGLDRPLFNNVENLNLLGAADLDATGNSHGNVLIGNSGANVLRGLGGNDRLNGYGGVDTLIGGAGNDHYTIDGDDTIVETAGGGVDTVLVGSDYSLVGTHLENIELAQGYVPWRATGNAADNVLKGNLAGNVLNGGRGGDRMHGGSGGDVYYVDDVRDRVYEEPGHGVDTVRSSIDYTLGFGLERLTLIGAGDISGRGNALDNILSGNIGDNVLRGDAGNDRLRGAKGDDTLFGGAGADSFLFRDGDGDDVIADFLHDLDRIDLRGVAGLDAFGQLGIADTDAGLRIDYGTGSIVLAGLHDRALLTASDFLI